MSLLDLISRNMVAAELAVSRSQTYNLEHRDPDFPPVVYLDPVNKAMPRFTRAATEAYKRKLIAAQRPGAPRRGRPPKGAPVQQAIIED